MTTRNITTDTLASAIPDYVDGDALAISNNATLTIDNDTSEATLGYGAISITAGGKMIVSQTPGTYGAKFGGNITGGGVWNFHGATTADQLPSNVQLNLVYASGVSCQLTGAMTIRCKEPTIPDCWTKAQYTSGTTKIYVVNSAGVDARIDLDAEWKVGYYLRIDNNSGTVSSQEFTIVNTGNDGGGSYVTLSGTGLASTVVVGSRVCLVGRNIMLTGVTSGATYAFNQCYRSVLNVGYRNFNYLWISCCGNTATNFCPSGCNYSLASCFGNTIANCSPSGSISYGLYDCTGNTFANCSPSGCAYGIYRCSGNTIGNCSPMGCTNPFLYCYGNTINGGTFGANTYHIRTSGNNDLRNVSFGEGTLWHKCTPLYIPPNSFNEIINYGNVAGAYNARSAGGTVVNESTIKPADRVRSYKHTGEATTTAAYPCFRQSKVQVSPGRTLLVAVDMYKDWANGSNPKCEIIDAFSDPLAGGTALVTQSLENTQSTWFRYTLSWTNTADYPVAVLIRTSMAETSGNFYAVYRWETDCPVSAANVVEDVARSWDATGIDVGTYPLTADSFAEGQANQYSTDQAEVTAKAAYLDNTQTICGIGGSLNMALWELVTTGDARVAAQLSSDRAAGSLVIGGQVSRRF